MMPVSSSYSLQGMSTLNFNNLLSNTNQTQTLPISALGNILQLHCNPSLTLQVNGPSPLIPVSTKETNNQDQINAFRNIFQNQPSYQNNPQDQFTSSPPRGFNQLIQELLSTYQSQQDTLSQVTVKYNFLLNAMERLLFDVQNNVEYSLLALGISQTINKVKLNQLNHLNQLNCASLISNGIVPMISQSHIFNNCTQTVPNQQNESIPVSSIIDLTYQRSSSDSTTFVSPDKKGDIGYLTSNASTSTTPSKPTKMTSLDKLDKLIDETVKKSSGKVPVLDNNNTLPNTKSSPILDEGQQSNVVDVNVNMGNAIHQIIRQFYQKASATVSNPNIGSDSSSNTIQQSVAKLQTDNLKSATNNFSQQVTEIFANSQLPFNSLGNRSNQSFILCNNLPTNSLVNGQNREPFLLSLTNAYQDNSTPTVAESLQEVNNATEDTESTSNREDDDLGLAELDPSEVATRIRDILSLHSIGQRLFAKHVLNLSQGTVSELLSKPKPWSKLSEKGRDSYRKMNQWAQDAGKVQELKSIAPRKGFSGHYAGMSPATPIKEDLETQEKIKRILNDAKMAMASTNSESSVCEEIFNCYAKSSESSLSTIPNDNSQFTTAVSNSTQSLQNNTTNVLEFDITQLQKKLRAALHSASVVSSARQESLPQISASVTYEQSPLIVMNLANMVPCSSSVVVPSVQHVYPTILPLVTSTLDTISDVETYQNGNNCGFIRSTQLNMAEPLNVKTESIGGSEEDKMEDKSTENCTDITFSVDQFPESNNNNPKSDIDLENLENFLKSFIGSIKLTENSFQKEDINTAELVNVIKDNLTKNSISQRTFGCLLGLSQGTVSDILSRPKPWSVLTNKGREPYIRMLKYLLKPIYFKVSDDCTNKTDSNDNKLIESLPNSSSSPSSSDAALTYDQNLIFEEKNNHQENVDCNLSSSTEGRDYQSWDDDVSETHVDVCGSPIVNLEQLQQGNTVKYDDSKERIFNIATRIVSIDTVELATCVKDILNTHNLGQRIFGDRILNLSQASVSELLSKPKTWAQLSLKGREPYVRMHLWLQHPDKLQILCKSIENKNCDSKVNERTENDGFSRVINIPISTNSGKTNSKRTRVIFTDFQKSELKLLFEKNPYPKPDQLSDLAKHLNLTIATVGNWFHNQRIRIRTKTNSNHQNTIVTKIESLSGESEINSEKSLPMNIDDIFDSSDSDNSITAPHLYPESNLQDYQDEDNYLSGNQPCSTIAGSNKRKRTNPIKLEMVVNKTSMKDNDDNHVNKTEREPIQKPNLFSVKIQKLDPNPN